MRLPDMVRVQVSGGGVRFADSTGAVVQEITTAGAAARTDSITHPTRGAGPAEVPPGAGPLAGRWVNGQLVVQSAGRHGTKLTRTYAVEDDGKTLVIRTHTESDGSTPPRDSKRVYRKVGNR